MRVAFKPQIAIPGLAGVHYLATVFHHQGFVKQDHGVVGGQLVGAAQVIEGRGAVVLALGGRSALEVGRRIVHQQAGSHGSGCQKAVENIDGGIIFFFQEVGTRL